MSTVQTLPERRKFIPKAERLHPAPSFAFEEHSYGMQGV